MVSAGGFLGFVDDSVIIPGVVQHEFTHELMAMKLKPRLMTVVSKRHWRALHIQYCHLSCHPHILAEIGNNSVVTKLLSLSSYYGKTFKTFRND